MYYYKYSKLTRLTILFNAVITSILGVYYLYNWHHIVKTNTLITNYISDNHVLRETAIRNLTHAGYDLYIGNEFSTLFGIFITIITLILLYFFKGNNAYLLTVMTAICCFLTSVLGGLLIFYLIATQKLESQDAVTLAMKQPTRQKTDWENFINQRANNNK